jgi:flagellar M-ring protein FliF
MNTTIGNIIKQISEFWAKQSSKRRMIIIGSFIGLILVAVAGSFIINQKNYVVLYRGLSGSEGSDILSKLDSMAVDSKVESDGTILVPANDEARLKMQLSSEGYPKTALTYDLFKNNSDFMTTDLEKKQYIIYQLQDRLQSSIETIQGVDSAIVTISVPDSSSFVLETDKPQTTASVIVNLENGVTLTTQQIKGVELLVARSVPGLTNQNVSIIDNTGAILNSGSSDSDIDISASKIDMQKKAGEMVRDKIIDLLKPVLGTTGVSVAANVVIDFQKKVISETQSQTQPTSSPIPSGTMAGTSTPSNIQTTPVPVINTDNVVVNEVQSQIQQDGGEIKDLTVAVMVDDKGLSLSEISKLKEMVAFAVGINTNKVVVSSIPFKAYDDAAKRAQQAMQNQKPANNILQYSYIAIPVAGLVAFMLVYLSRKGKKKKKEEIKKDEEYVKNQLAVLKQGGKIKEEDIPGAIVLSENRQQGLNRQIKDFSSTNPDIVAQLLRTWIVEGEE